jgi:hypothetical protein
MTFIGRTSKKAIAQCICGNIRNYSYKMLRDKATSHYDGCNECNKLKTRQRAQASNSYKARRIFQMYKRTAKQRNINFELNISQVESLVFNPCHYCGKPPSNF